MSGSLIRFKRGNKADLPQSATSGTPLWCEDTKELYIGDGNGVSKVGAISNVVDNNSLLNLIGVSSDDSSTLKKNTSIKMQGGTVSAQTFNGNDIVLNGSGTTTRGVRGICGENDGWRIAGGATDTNSGFLEIATTNDGDKPIYVCQYESGQATSFTNLKRTATLLDEFGNTQFPGSLKVEGQIYGNCSNDSDGNPINTTYVKNANLIECHIITETYINGSSWYRVYSDGWCEQGGKCSSGAAITYLKSFKDTNYSLMVTKYGQSSAFERPDTGITAYSATGFTFTTSGNVYGNHFFYACGYIN